MVLVDFDKDYYAILGLENTATLDEIKRTYRVLAKQYHPDVNRAANAPEIFNAISEAYEVLSDPKQREAYDAVAVGRVPASREAGAAAANGGVYRPRPRDAPADVRRERTLLLSLLVPGLYQLAEGDRKFGALLLVVYLVFWGLAMVYNVEIGILAVLVWAFALLDAYGSFRKRLAGSDN